MCTLIFKQVNVLSESLHVPLAALGLCLYVSARLDHIAQRVVMIILLEEETDIVHLVFVRLNDDQSA